MKCQNCGKDLVNVEGKRPKKFCGSNCRSTFWQKQRRVSDSSKEIFTGQQLKQSSDTLKEVAGKSIKNTPKAAPIQSQYLQSRQKNKLGLK